MLVLMLCTGYIKVVEVKLVRWRSVLLAVGVVFKFASTSLVLALFNRCSPSAQSVKVRVSGSIPRTDAKTARVGKSPANAKCSKFTLTKVYKLHFKSSYWTFLMLLFQMQIYFL